MPEQAIPATRLRITGTVQGVGYRDWAVRTCRRLGLRGWVRNRLDGSVEALVAGNDASVKVFIEACRKGPPLARVEEVIATASDAAGWPNGFAKLATE